MIGKRNCIKYKILSGIIKDNQALFKELSSLISQKIVRGAKTEFYRT